jgi:hypothetical protein
VENRFGDRMFQYEVFVTFIRLEVSCESGWDGSRWIGVARVDIPNAHRRPIDL